MKPIDLVLDLVSSANDHDPVQIISPYITAKPIRSIQRAIGNDTHLEVTAVFSYELFTNGSSSLGAFSILSKRANTVIYAVDNLHAKVYISGKSALIGSANCTDRGLGLSSQSNIELLSMVDSGDRSIVNLIGQINAARAIISHKDITEMQAMISSHRCQTKAIIKRRMERALAFDSWMPSCSLKYLLQYLKDGSFFRVPQISRDSITCDAQHLSIAFGDLLDSGEAYKLMANIAEIPIIQLSIECNLKKDHFLGKCLKASGVDNHQIEALENWSNFCINNMLGDTV